ncbi:MAG: hypothetical protein AB1473_22935 [Thermodesulfobacteriota bacterium]
MRKTKKKIKAMLKAVGLGSSQNPGRAKANSAELTQEPPGTDGRASNGGVLGTSKRKSFSEKLQLDFAAVTFAEAGEFETARDIAATKNKARTVLLVIEGESPIKMSLNHALGLCKRMGAELDVLQVIQTPQDLSDPNELGRRMAEASSNIVRCLQDVQRHEIPFKVTLRLGNANDKLVDYVKQHKDVGIVVLDSPQAGSPDTRSRQWRRLVERLSQKLAVPLVTITDRNPLDMPVGP